MPTSGYFPFTEVCTFSTSPYVGRHPTSPGPYCFHFNSGATIPSPASPHVMDRGTTPRDEGKLRYKPGLPGRISNPGPAGGVPNRTGWGSRWRCCPHEIPQMSNDGITMRVRGALKPPAPCAHRAGRTGHELRARQPRQKT